MGMDVYGRTPSSERGEYFRSNIWWWHPLAAFLQAEFSQETSACELWHSNDGDGLDKEAAQRLATALDAALQQGRVEEHLQQLNAAAASVDRQACTLCKGTGLRRDEVGVRYGYDRRDPSTGTGGCNGCQGLGTTLPLGAEVCFSREHVEEFADFLRESGGFSIW